MTQGQKQAGSLVGAVLTIVAVIWLIHAGSQIGNTANTAANQLHNAASQLQQQEQHYQQQVTNAQNQLQRASRPPEGSSCTPRGGGNGVIVYHSFDNGYDCVWQ